MAQSRLGYGNMRLAHLALLPALDRPRGWEGGSEEVAWEPPAAAQMCHLGDTLHHTACMSVDALHFE